MEMPGDLGRMVVRPVVNDDDLVAIGIERLIDERLQRCAQQQRPVPRGDYDADHSIPDGWHKVRVN